MIKILQNFYSVVYFFSSNKETLRKKNLATIYRTSDQRRKTILEQILLFAVKSQELYNK